VVCILLGSLASACGGGQPEAKAPEPAAGTVAPAAEGTGAPAKPWKTMSLSEKKAHMKTVVVPKMSAVFQSFDPKGFADVGCGTCHGNGAKNGTFVMPNPDLPKLSVANNFKKHMDAKPEITKFMMEKVEPEMAAALGMPPYDPQTHQGFGCGGCHTFEK
jgi:hypothetical protein